MGPGKSGPGKLGPGKLGPWKMLVLQIGPQQIRSLENIGAANWAPGMLAPQSHKYSYTIKLIHKYHTSSCFQPGVGPDISPTRLNRELNVCFLVICPICLESGDPYKTTQMTQFRWERGVGSWLDTQLTLGKHYRNRKLEKG